MFGTSWRPNDPESRKGSVSQGSELPLCKRTSPQRQAANLELGVKKNKDPVVRNNVRHLSLADEFPNAARGGSHEGALFSGRHLSGAAKSSFMKKCEAEM